MSELIGFDGLETAVTELIADLNRAVQDVDSEAEEAAQNAAGLILAEQKRLFRKAVFRRDKQRHTYKYADETLIKIMRDERSAGRVYKLKIGYDTETLRRYPELLLIEFGRPGKSRKRAKRTDSTGRKKGTFPAHVSHIRAGALFAKDKAAKAFTDRLFEIAADRFSGG